MNTCRVCGQSKPLDEFTKDSRLKTGHTTRCKVCSSDAAKQWHYKNRTRRNKYLSDRWYQQKHEHPERHLWWLAKRRAEESGIPFSITPSDLVVPDICPVRGVKMSFRDGGYSPDSPSVDRFIPEYGYVPGNVSVISHKANTMKSNATIEELRGLVAWVEAGLAAIPVSLAVQT